MYTFLYRAVQSERKVWFSYEMWSKLALFHRMHTVCTYRTSGCMKYDLLQMSFVSSLTLSFSLSPSPSFRSNRPANVCDNIAFSSFGFGCFQFPLTENWIFRFVWFASKLRRDYMACGTATWIVYHVSNGIQHVYMHTNVRIWTIDEMSNTELPIEKCRSVFFFSHIFADPYGIP